MDDTQHVVEGLIGKLREEHPDLIAIMDAVKCGELTDARGMALMKEYLTKNPKAEGEVMALAHDKLAPLRGQVMDVPELGELPGGIIQTDQDRLPRLNPLFEAALIERTQFDGDIPEHRTAPLPHGVKAAVPVQTDARDPAVLGTLLEKASDLVTSQVREHETARLLMVNQVAEGNLEALALIQKAACNLTLRPDEVVDIPDLIRGSKETDHPAYRRGQLPAPVQMASPRGAALAQMSDDERRKHAYKFLSTTQGRRSAEGVIRRLIAGHLGHQGYVLTEHDLEGQKPGFRKDVLVEHTWRVNLSGAGGTQPAFSLVDVAARALATGLAKGVNPRTATLEVWAVNTVEDREVGWAARLLPST